MAWFRYKWRFLGVGILALATVGTAWLALQAKHAGDMADPGHARRHGEPIPVRTALVTEQEIDQVIGATVLTFPSASISIRVGQISSFSANAPLTDIVIKKVNVQQGDPVRKGQVLYELDDSLFQEAHKQRLAAFNFAKADLERVREEIKYNQKLRELSLASAEAEVKYRNDDLDIRKKELEAYKQLERTKAASLFDLYQAMSYTLQAGFQQAEAGRHLVRAKDEIVLGPLRDKSTLTSAESAFETARVSLAVFEHDMGRLKLESPIDGFVDYGSNPFTGSSPLEAPVPGMVVVINSPIGQVYKTDPILVRLDYPQERLDELSVGMKAEVVLDSFPKETFAGKVIRVSPQVNSSLRVVPVDVEVANPNNRIKGGISGYVRLRVHKKGLTMPATAVLQHGNKAMAFRVENGRARIREVRVGNLLETGLLEVRDGLAAGDEVVLYQGFYSHAGELVGNKADLQDNDPVDVNWRKWARRD
jgi:multidrug efflux pump subunit AcrA (membrane-fusion protein)